MVIFVANLPMRMRPAELSELFHDKVTHRSKGYGFVQMDNEDEAMQAISALNESTYCERVIHAAVARGAAATQTQTEPEAVQE